MTVLRPLRMAVLDFCERSRQYGFLVTLVSMLYAAYVFLPAKGAGYTTVNLAGWRGLYNSAFVGASVALLATVFLSLVGFYLVKSAIERDRRTGVGEILATTRMSSVSYLFAKAFSNLLVLSSMIGVLIVAAAVIQWLRAEDRAIDLLKLTTPFLFMTLPVMALTAAIAVLFESLKPLRGTLGNVVWFFLWMGLMVNPAAMNNASKGEEAPFWLDAGGSGFLINRILDGGSHYVTDFDRNKFSIGINIGGAIDRSFPWDGIRWTAGIVERRAAWLLVAGVIVLVASVFFDRFDPARGVGRKRGRRERTPAADAGVAPAPGVVPLAATSPAPVMSLAPPVPVIPSAGLNLGALVRAELRLMLKGRSRWWFLVSLVLLVVGLFLPLKAARHLWPFSWIWPLAIWSGLGCRDALSGTRDLLDSSPRPLARQFPALLIAGVTVALLTGLAVGVRQAIAGDTLGLFAWFSGSLFIAAFAIAAGTWTGNGRLFEGTYLLLWYMGPVQGFGPLDFMGVSEDPGRAGAAVLFFGLGVLFTILAVLGRRRSLLRF